MRREQVVQRVDSRRDGALELGGASLVLDVLARPERVGRAVRKKFTGSGWFDGSVTSIADGSFEVRWSDGDETSYPFKAATKMLDAAEGTAVAPVAAAVAAPVVE